jgi:hypothetical protein
MVNSVVLGAGNSFIRTASERISQKLLKSRAVNSVTCTSTTSQPPAKTAVNRIPIHRSW